MPFFTDGAAYAHAYASVVACDVAGHGSDGTSELFSCEQLQVAVRPGGRYTRGMTVSGARPSGSIRYPEVLASLWCVTTTSQACYRLETRPSSTKPGERTCRAFAWRGRGHAVAAGFPRQADQEAGEVPSPQLGGSAGLSCQGLTAPEAVDVEHPVFAWQLRSGERGWQQATYQVRVGTDRALATTGAALWDSGRVSSSRSGGVTYRDRARQSCPVFLGVYGSGTQPVPSLGGPAPLPFVQRCCPGERWASPWVTAPADLRLASGTGRVFYSAGSSKSTVTYPRLMSPQRWVQLVVNGVPASLGRPTAPGWSAI